MVSKQVKLRLALTRAIVKFFSQEDLYCDELQIQGTLCVTADKSSIFITQITETITDAVSDTYRADLREEERERPSDRPSNPQYAPVREQISPGKRKSRQKPVKKSEASGSLNHLLSTGLGRDNLPLNDTGFQPYDPLHKFNISEVKNDKKDGKFDNTCSSDSENSLEGCVIVQPSRQNKHPAAPSTSCHPQKKSKTDFAEEPDGEKSVLNLRKGGSPRPASGKGDPWTAGRLPLPTPLPSPLSTPVFPGTPERQFALPIKQEKLDDLGSVDLRVATSPSTGIIATEVPGIAEFPWQLSSPPDSHSSLSDWPANSWVRKPKTKFSPEQLRLLEDAYQTDPFLSTCAERRSELARKLSLTEKNIQIWFQNQRRRRRAAAYSKMHYAADGADTSTANAELDQSTDMDLEHVAEKENNTENEEEEIVEVREDDLDEEDCEKEGRNEIEDDTVSMASAAPKRMENSLSPGGRTSLSNNCQLENT